MYVPRSSVNMTNISNRCPKHNIFLTASIKLWTDHISGWESGRRFCFRWLEAFQALFLIGESSSQSRRQVDLQRRWQIVSFGYTELKTTIIHLKRLPVGPCRIAGIFQIRESYTEHLMFFICYSITTTLLRINRISNIINRLTEASLIFLY